MPLNHKTRVAQHLHIVKRQCANRDEEVKFEREIARLNSVIVFWKGKCGPNSALVRNERKLRLEVERLQNELNAVIAARDALSRSNYLLNKHDGGVADRANQLEAENTTLKRVIDMLEKELDHSHKSIDKLVALFGGDK